MSFARFLRHPELTPSARMLQGMRDQGIGFFHYALQKSEEAQDHFKAYRVSAERETEFKQEVEESRRRQTELEASDEVSFDEFLRRYFEQAE